MLLVNFAKSSKVTCYTCHVSFFGYFIKTGVAVTLCTHSLSMCYSSNWLEVAIIALLFHLSGLYYFVLGPTLFFKLDLLCWSQIIGEFKKDIFCLSHSRLVFLSFRMNLLSQAFSPVLLAICI